MSSPRPDFGRAASGVQSLLPADDAFGLAFSSVDVLSLDLHDAALLHRDPPAERSRLATRRFVASAAKQWFVSDGDGGEILCAQIMITRFRSAADAALAEADSWSELHAGNALFRSVPTDDDHQRVAVVPEGGTMHAVAFGRVNDVTIATFTMHLDIDVCTSVSALMVSNALRKCGRPKSNEA